MDNVFKLHGLPTSILSDRDKIFTGKQWSDLFSAHNLSLHRSTSYHPQTDWQYEWVNQCLENYLGAMTFQEPTKRLHWLPLAEYWYNTSYHTSLESTPFQALYGYLPPLITEVVVPGHITTASNLSEKEQMLVKLKHDLQDAQTRMKYYDDRNRSDCSFQVGDMLYLKMQPYRETTLGLHKSIKLDSRYYGPFKILEAIRTVAYHLLLPSQATIHPIFHISHFAPYWFSCNPNAKLPLLDSEGKIRVQPLQVRDRRLIPCKNTPVV